MHKKLWFKTKTYGWGWTPASWQGWLVIVLFVLFLIWDARRLHVLADPFIHRGFIFHFIIATVLLIGICWYTGETPRWRWGDKE